MGSRALDTKLLKIKGQTVPLAVHRNPRARRLTLRLDAAGGGLHLVLPWGVSQAEGLDFARSRFDWIESQLAALPPRVPFAPGATIPFLGRPHVIRHMRNGRRGVWREPGRINVSGQIEHLPRRVADFLKAEARQELSWRAHEKAAQVKRRIASISLRDTRSRWGSCSHSGSLNFSWRLVLAPAMVADYVVAHEVAHLVHLNHSPRFWSLVARLTDHSDQAERWLKANGPSLLRYG